MDDRGGDARSAAGHAAFSMRGVDDRWVLIQVSTFTNWVNEQLRSKDTSVSDLQEDFCDGIRLCDLLEVLQEKRIGRVVRRPLNRHHHLENVTLALRAMQEDNLKLVNIGSEDIVNGNLKLIMGVIWRLILRYQIGKASKVPPKQLMLAWLQAVLPDCRIRNFSTDWNDGLALHALIEYCRPGTSPDWRKLDRRNAEENCRRAMQLAKKHFDIPMILTPENMSSSDLDELSGMTYLSYFMKVDSPGYHATMRYVKDKVPQSKINNFQTDWNDGQVLTSLVTSCGAHVTGPELDKTDWVGRVERAMHAAETIGVQPVISAREIADVDVDHLGVMAYAAWFQKHSPGASTSPRPPIVVAPPSPVVKETPPTPIQLQSPRLPPSQAVAVTQVQKETLPNNLSPFTIELLEEDVSKENVVVEIVGPDSKPPISLSWQGQTGYGHFTPREPGEHQMFVYNQGQLVDGCPQVIKVKAGHAQVRLTEPIPEDASVGAAVPIKINAATARKESVRVEARAPSGRVMEMGVGEANGCYTANFTPTEVGDWSISIFYENAHIQGSPFQVRVYDAAQVKVFGLEGGAVGQTFSFSADCSSAGQGELSTEIRHNGQIIPSQINATNDPAVKRISFVPSSPGIYTIKVYFAGIEIGGSPYTLDIVDSNLVRAAGDGLASVEVGRMATFVVNTHGARGGDIRVNISGPNGTTVPCQVVNIGDSTYRVEYMPQDVGTYTIDVRYYGKHIQGSPFKVMSSDWNQIKVLNLHSTGQVGRAVEFDIDASTAGTGNLEIMVNEGTIPCSVQNRGNRQFHASFIPKEPILHLIQMRFNGREVPESPWRVMVQGASHVTTSGAGLQMVAARSLASFEVRTGSPDGNITATVVTPTQRRVPVQVVNKYNGTYLVEYSPSEVGIHTIDVRYNNIPIPGAPFSAKVYDPSAILISQIPNGIVGKPVEFTIDVNQAGEGQLEIMVNRGSVPNTVKMLRKGVFQVTFTPRDSHDHQVDVKFNGELLPFCPITVPILDASRVTVHGEGIRQVAVNRSSFFRVNTQSAGEADLNVRVTAPNGDLVPAKMVAQPDGDYKVEYSSKYTGRHTVEILYAGNAIMGSPFYVEIYDPNKIRVEGVTNGVVGQSISFDILRHEAGKAELGLTIRSPTGRDVMYQTVPIPQGDRITYVPQEPGAYLIYITYGGLDVPGCPLTQKITDASSVTVYGDGLLKGEEGRPASFFVKTDSNAHGDLWVQVDGPNSIAKCNIESREPGLYQVTYIPVETGTYTIQVKWNGKLVVGSPYRPKIGRSSDSRKVVLLQDIVSLDSSGRLLLKVGQEKRLEFDTSSAGSGILTALLVTPAGSLPVDVQPYGDRKQVVSFTPLIAGEHTLSVYWDGSHVPHSPFSGNAKGMGVVVNHEKVVLTGRGLKEARVRENAEFVVDGRSAGPGIPHVKLEGVKSNIEVTPLPMGNNMFRFVYRPTIPGAYLLYISWSDRQVKGSPFKVNVISSSDASRVVASGEGLKMGVMGQEIKSVIDTRRAGPGELTAHCQGPTREAYCSLYNNHDGTFTLTIKPQEPGRHTLQIKYDDEHVPGSPYTLRVSGAPDASKVVVKGPGIEHGILALYQSRFIVETKGAGAGQLTVRIRGPKGAFRVEMQRDSSKDRTILCRYDPTEVGDYLVHVKWSGEHVPGSPFHVRIADTQDELERFLADGNLHSLQSNRTLESRMHNMDF